MPQLLRGQMAAAIAAAEEGPGDTASAVKIRFLAARVFAESRAAGSRAIARRDAGPRAASRAAGIAQNHRGESCPEQWRCTAGNQTPDGGTAILDTWIGHFDLGRAYLAAGQLLQADSEFDRCIKRQGEALSLFLDEEPTYGYFPLVYTTRAVFAKD